MSKTSKARRVVVAVIGSDQVGIVAKVATVMMNHNINIEDISQKVFSGDVFTMTMMADISKSDLALNEVAGRIDEALEGMGLQVTVHDAELFQYMHRV